MTLVNAYTVRPSEIKPGDEMLLIVKAMVTYRDVDGQLHYRLYRCPWNRDEIPQGSRVDETMRIDCALFPSLTWVGSPG